MSRWPDVSGTDLIKALQKDGWVVLRQKGSHVSMEKKAVGESRRTVIPLHRELARGTLQDILKQTGLSRDDLIGLL